MYDPKSSIKKVTIDPKEGDNPELFKTIIRLYHELDGNDISFCYRGPFLERFTNTILEISSGATAPLRMLPMVNRKLSFLLVECFQNILRHGESLMGDLPDLKDGGLFSFRKLHQDFIINSINLLQDNDTSNLKELVDNVNRLDSGELKELYLKQLQLSQLTDKGGAGLGLIELARKSGQPLLYEMESTVNNLTSFHQQVTFTTGDKSQESPVNLIATTKNNYRQMVEENIFLYYKGDFSQKSILPMLDIVEHNVNEMNDINNNGRKTGHILIELLQNISKHGGGHTNGAKDGIFIIGKTEDHTFIEVANPVHISEKNFIEEKITYLRSLSPDELKDLHRKALKASLKFESKHKSGLGLIEIAQTSSAPLKYIFEPLGDDLFLFSLYVRI